MIISPLLYAKGTMSYSPAISPLRLQFSTTTTSLPASPTQYTQSQSPQTAFVLNYPNPFSLTEGTVFRYQLSQPTDVTIDIINLIGQKVFSKTLLANQEGGRSNQFNIVPFSSADLNGDTLPAGTYIYLLRTHKTLLGKGKLVILP